MNYVIIYPDEMRAESLACYRLFTEYIPFPGAKRPVNDAKK